MKKDSNKVTQGWLHHATKESVCLELNGPKYKQLVEEGYRNLLSDVLKDKKILEEAEADQTEGLSEIPSNVKSLTNDELEALYNECDDELVDRGLLSESNEEDAQKSSDVVGQEETSDRVLELEAMELDDLKALADICKPPVKYTKAMLKETLVTKLIAAEIEGVSDAK